MRKIKEKCKLLTTNKWFELGIVCVIVVNSVLIGVETYTSNDIISMVQKTALYIFTVEIIMRYIAADNNKEFFSDGWNVFDLTLVAIGYIPESLVTNASMMMAIRVLRILRVLRLLRAAEEIKVIVTVLLRSLSAMVYNVILFFIFIYLYAIIGVGLFRLPDPEKMTSEEKMRYEQFQEIAPNAPVNSPDPYGTLDEAMFTLFRELTSEDWTDIRYNHITASKMNIINVSTTVVNIYHISWFVLAAFLLLNLVTGAIINNYQNVMEENKKRNLAATD